MADQKLSELTAITSLADTDLIYVTDYSTSPISSKKITYANFKTALLARANHTGTQAASTISDFDTEVSNNTDVTANTAKVSADNPAMISALDEATVEGTDYVLILDTSVSPNALKKILASDLITTANATHTGDATGDTALTLQPEAISGKGAVTASGSDYVLVLDTSDSPNTLKKALVSDLGSAFSVSDITGAGVVTVAATDLLVLVDTSASPQVLGQVTAQSVADLFDASGYLPLSGGELTGDITFAAASPEHTVDGRNLSADGAKLDGIEAGATADQTANEILTAIKTVDGTGSGLDADLLDGNEATAFATAAQANATHTGDATGATALTLQPVAITGKGAVTVDGADLLLVTDVSASPQVLGQVTAQSIANLAPAVQGSAILSSDTSPLVTDGYVLTATGTGTAAWEAPAASGGDFKADGSVDMTGEFRTDVGTFDSDVADGASAVAYSYDTAAGYSTAGSKLASWKNSAAEKFFIDKDGSIGTGAGVNSLNISVDGRNQIQIVEATTNSKIAIGDNATLGGNTSISIGVNATPSGTQAIALGYNTDAIATQSIAIGRQAQATHFSGLAIAGERYSADGDNQFLLWQPAATTTDATPATLYLDEDGASNRMSVASGKCHAFEAHIVGVQSDGTDASYFVRRGIIANNSGTTALIGSIQTIGTDIESNASTDVAVTADNTNDALQISVTGIAAETWRWSANVFVKDITIGT